MSGQSSSRRQGVLMGLDLTERQRSTVAGAITLTSGVVLVAVVLGCLYLAGQVVSRFSGVFVPLAAASVAALILKPYYHWLHRTCRLPALAAVAVTFASVLVPLGAMGWLVGVIALEQLGMLISEAPQWVEDEWALASERWPIFIELWEVHVAPSQQGAAAAGDTRLLGALTYLGGFAWVAGTSIVQWVLGLFNWAVTPVYVAFLLMMSPPKLSRAECLPFLKPRTRDDVVFLAREFVSIVVAFFRGQLLIALIQGVLYGIGFTIVGLRFGLVFGLLFGLLNIIPYLGSILGLAIALPLAWLQVDGGTAVGVGVVVVFMIVQIIEGYLLTPRIMGHRTGLHPMVIIIAILFWGSALGGIAGMILAIPLTAFLVVFWRLIREHYMREVV